MNKGLIDIVVLGLELFGTLAFLLALDRSWRKDDTKPHDEEEE